MKALRASMFGCLLSCLAACSSTSPAVITEYRQVYLPDSLLAGCPGVEWPGGTYRELAALAAERKSRLKDCDDRFAAARKYQNDLRAKEALEKTP